MIVLDTHVLVWWVSDPGKISSKALSAIHYAKQLGVCPISCWEISTKVSKGHISLDRDLRVWMRQVLARPSVLLLDLSAEVAIAAGELGEQGFHGDPADRLIVATALHLGAELVTKDAAIRAFTPVRTVW